MVDGFLYIIGAFAVIGIDLFLEKRRRLKRISIDRSINELKKAVKELSVGANREMTKADLVDKVIATGLTKKQAAKAIEAVLAGIKDVLGSGEKAQLINFGSKS